MGTDAVAPRQVLERRWPAATSWPKARATCASPDASILRSRDAAVEAERFAEAPGHRAPGLVQDHPRRVALIPGRSDQSRARWRDRTSPASEAARAERVWLDERQAHRSAASSRGMRAGGLRFIVQRPYVGFHGGYRRGQHGVHQACSITVATRDPSVFAAARPGVMRFAPPEGRTAPPPVRSSCRPAQRGCRRSGTEGCIVDRGSRPAAQGRSRVADELDAEHPTHGRSFWSDHPPHTTPGAAPRGVECVVLAAQAESPRTASAVARCWKTAVGGGRLPAAELR
jgi:hypothetical protein